MISPVQLGLFALTMAAGQFTPGPDMLLILKNTLNHGLRTARWTILGICCGIVIHTTLAVSGLAVLTRHWPGVFRAVQIAGALYLIRIGWLLLRSALQTPAHGCPLDARAEPIPPPSPAQAFLEGFLTNLANVKAALFFSFMISQFVGDSVAEKIVYGTLLVAEAALLWPLFAWIMQQRPVRDRFFRRQRLLNGIFAALLFAVAAHLALTGL